jgi:hypothetical protein
MQIAEAVALDIVVDIDFDTDMDFRFLGDEH